MIKKGVLLILFVILLSSSVSAVSVFNKPNSVDSGSTFTVILQADEDGKVGCTRTFIDSSDWKPWHEVDEDETVECQLTAPETTDTEKYLFYAAEDNNNDGDHDDGSIIDLKVEVTRTDKTTDFDNIDAPSSAGVDEEFTISAGVSDEDGVDYIEIKRENTDLIGSSEQCGDDTSCTISRDITESSSGDIDYYINVYDSYSTEKTYIRTVTISNQAPSIGELSPLKAEAGQEYDGEVKKSKGSDLYN